MDSTLLSFLIIMIKKILQSRAGRERIAPYQSKDPSRTIPAYEKKREKETRKQNGS